MVKHNDCKFSMVSRFSLDTPGTDGDNSLFCKTQLVGNTGLGVLVLTVWEHLNAFFHKTALAGKGCCSLAGPVERSL